jgi:hypothetical protein
MFRSKTEAAAYLSGMIDGEGNVRLYQSQTGAAGRISVYNNDLALVRAIEEACDLFGAEYSRYARYPSPSRPLSKETSYIVQIGKRKSIIALSKVLCLRSPKKDEALGVILEYYDAARGWKRKEDRPIAELNSYLVLHTQKEAAQHFQVSVSTIEKWVSTERRLAQV